MHFLQLSISNNSVQVLLPICLSDAQDLERVLDHSLLHSVVERTVSLERRSLVDLEQPRLRVGVDQDVEAEHFKAHVEGAVVGLAGSVVVQEVGLAADQSLDDQIGDFELEQVHVDAVIGQPLVHCFQRALRACAILDVLVSYLEVCCVLINCIVGQVRLLGHLALALLQAVRLSGEASDAFLVPENRERVTRSYQHVEAQVELEAV